MSLRDSGLARNTGALLMGHLVRAPVLAVYFVVATRTLGVDAYGVLVAVAAIVAIAAPFSALGAGSLIVKHGAVDPRQTRTWLGAGLTMCGLGTLVLGGVVLLLAPWLAPVGTPLLVVAGVVVSEFVLGRTVDVSAAVFVAREEMHLTALCQLSFAVSRLVAAGVLLALPVTVTLESWVAALVVGSAVAALFSLWLAARAAGRPRLGLGPYRGHVREGALFAVGIGVQTAHNDVDKAMLGRIDGAAASGVYGAAYRVVDMAWTPMRALLAAAHPRMFRHGAGGVAELGPFVRSIARPALLYSAAVTVAMILGAGLLVPLLGEEFEEAVGVLRALAVLVLLRCCYYLAADMLTGVGRQGVRTAIQVVVLGANVGLNLVLIPLYGVWGAVWATLACELALAVALWAALVLTARAEGGRG